MKRRSTHIIFAFTLLLSFITGQVIAYGHTHHDALTKTAQAKHGKSRGTADDGCKICQQQHHTPAALSSNSPLQVQLIPLQQSSFGDYHRSYATRQLQLSFDRGPPAV